MKTSASTKSQSKETGPGQSLPETHFDLVAVAASAGGLRALTRVLEMLPGDFPAVIAVVQHLDPHRPSLMAPILGRRTDLIVKQAEDNELIQLGCVYIAPPDRHLLINSDRTISLSRTQLVHYVRPSGDLLFESVAAAFHERAIAVVLSGTGVDGTTGVKAIKKMGGIVVAQDEKSSEFFGMPGSAIQAGCVDFVLPLDLIAPTLYQLALTGGIK